MIRNTEFLLSANTTTLPPIQYGTLGQNIINFQVDKALGNVFPMVGQWAFFLGIALCFFGIIMSSLIFFVGDSNLIEKDRVDNMKKGTRILTYSVVGIIILLFLRIGFSGLASIFNYNIREPLENITKTNSANTP
jgi:hypothetical protein